MIRTNLFNQTDSHRITESLGCFSVLEYEKDISVTPESAEMAYFASEMNVRKRQLIAKTTEENGILVQAGAMQMMLGGISAVTDVKGAGDLVKKFLESSVTKETTIKPRYIGDGYVVLEPTFKYIILEDLQKWNGTVLIEDGMFLSCEDSIWLKVVPRNTLSSAVLGGEGLFNTVLSGEGVVAFESPVPADELIEVELTDDVVKLDGSMAIAWSEGLKFTVERTTKTLIGSAASGEGLVNVYRGTGKVLVAPVERNIGISAPKKQKG